VSLKVKKTQDLRTRKAAYQVFEANAQRYDFTSFASPRELTYLYIYTHIYIT
jgi:MoxR-like ATPase